MKNPLRLMLLALLIAVLLLAYVLFIRWRDRPPEERRTPENSPSAFSSSPNPNHRGTETQRDASVVTIGWQADTH